MDSKASAKDFVFKAPKRTIAESNSSSSEEKQYLETDEGTISRKKTTVEVEFAKRQAAAQMFVSTLPPESELPTVDPYIPQGLSGAVFCGPVLPDLDSIASSIAAAELYGGVAARAAEVNAESNYALRVFGAIKPRPIEGVLKSFPSSSVCLIDHQQTSQLSKSIPVDRIVGVIDRHALQNSTIVTDMPIYIDIRPWGSVSTIIAHSFLTLNRRPAKSTAGMLLCAILSATLNLQGPTTTEWDRLMVAVLVELAGVEDVQYLAAQQFKAKSSELAALSPSALCNGDQKVFTFKTSRFEGSVGFAVIETVDDAVIMGKTSELLVALNADKESKGLSVLFLAVVNIVALKTSLLLCGPNEKSLAIKAFSNGRMSSRGEHHNHVMDLGDLVSRKKNFIPAISAAIQKGWKPE